MDKNKFQDLKRHQATVVQAREKYEDVYKSICTYVLPMRYNWDEENEESDADRPVVYDATAVEANRILADGYQGYLVNPRSPWLNLRFEEPSIDKTNKAETWKTMAEDRLYRIFARSNFYSALGMVLMDGALGTATMYTERHEQNVVNYIPQHLKGIYIEQNRSGEIDTVFHRMRLSARDLLTTYPDSIPSNKKKDYERNPFEKHTTWRAVLPNKDRVLRSLGPRGMKYSSITYTEDMDKPLKEGGYKRLPYDIWRPMVLTGEAYGKSAAWFALGDIKRLNLIQKDLLELASLTVKPPLNVPSEQLESVNVTPWGMNPYSDPSRQVFPMGIGGNFPYGIEELREIQNQVRGYFNVEAFQMLSMNSDKEYTATQSAEMAGEKSASLTALTSRVTRFLDGIVENTLLIGLDSGFIPMPPPELMQSGLKIDYVGPLTMDQERAFQTTGIIRGLNGIVPFLEAKPSIWNLIKENDVFRKILEGSGFPKGLLRNPAELKAIEEEQARQQEEMRQSQLQKEGAQAYKDGSYEAANGSLSAEVMKNGR